MEDPPSQPPSTTSASSDEASGSLTRSKSPISQLLESLGMTREDLSKRSAQMREFLTAQNSAASGSFNDFDDLPYTKNSFADSSSSAAKTGASASSSQRYYRDIETPAPNSSGQSSTPAASKDYYSRTRPPILSATPSSAPNASNAVNGPPAALTPQYKKDDTRRMSHKERSSHSHHAHPPSGPSQATSPVKSKPSLDEIMHMRARTSRRSRITNPIPESSEESSDESAPKRDTISPSFNRDNASTSDLSASASPMYQSDSGVDWNARGGRTAAKAAAQYRRDAYPKVAASSPYYRSSDRPTTSTQEMQEPAKQVSPQGDKIDETFIIEQNPQSSSYYRDNYEEVINLPSSSPASTPSITSGSSHRRSESKISDFSSPSKYSSFSDDLDIRDPDHLPYTLPPGPYNDEKPDLSYAAMIGRAILASPNHRLKLKDIYDYISTVFPHFKRPLPGMGGSHSAKWMNAVRQNLTNTPQFRKIGIKGGVYDSGKECAKGGWWAIMDEDLWCFRDGGYTKRATDMPETLRGDHIAMDTTKLLQYNEASHSMMKKREGEDLASVLANQPARKRAKKGQSYPSSAMNMRSLGNPYHFPYNSSGQLVQPLTLGVYNPQGYYYSATQQGMAMPYLAGQQGPYGFSLLPQADNLATAQVLMERLVGVGSSSSDAELSEAISALSPPLETSQYDEDGDFSVYESKNQGSLGSAPDLTSDETSGPAESRAKDVFSGSCDRAEHGLLDFSRVNSTTTTRNTKSGKGSSSASTSLKINPGDVGISPRRVFGGYSPEVTKTNKLGPGIDFLDKESLKDNNKRKGKRSQVSSAHLPIPPMPSSPTMQRKNVKKSKEAASILSFHAVTDFTAPTSRPSTPPRDTTTHPLSSIRTPIKRTSQSPEPSKSTLHVLPIPPMGDHLDNDRSSLLHTPSRTRTLSEGSSSQLPVTPNKKLLSASPYLNLPGLGFSPFRTPSRRVMEDPNDPSALLEEEIAQLRTLEMIGTLGTPGGLFSEKVLLYESPSLPSPSAWTRPW